MMKNLFYRLIDSQHIEKAPMPLQVSRQNIFSNSEKLYNQNGYYRIVKEAYPTDGGVYEPLYELKDNVIYMTWKAGTVSVENRISHLKENLADTDYQAIKYAEGWITDEEYEPLKLQRQAWRDEINRLESSMDNNITEGGDS
jgi:hypothetical protein